MPCDGLWYGLFRSVGLQIATIRTAEGVELELFLSRNFQAHPIGFFGIAFNPCSGLSRVSVSEVQDVTGFHFGLTL